METATVSFGRRQYLWRLWCGFVVCTVAGAVWVAFGLQFGRSPLRPPVAWLIAASGALLLFVSSRGLKRQSQGFRLSDSMAGSPEQQAATLRLRRQFQIVVSAEVALIMLGDAICAGYYHRPLLAVLVTGLVVSLHFFPLARIFKIATYYATGAAGTVVCLLAILVLPASSRFLVGGVGLGAVLWLSAIDVLWRADRLTERALRH